MSDEHVEGLITSEPCEPHFLITTRGATTNSMWLQCRLCAWMADLGPSVTEAVLMTSWSRHVIDEHKHEEESVSESKWVTINGAGPYEVVGNEDIPDGWLIIATPGMRFASVWAAEDWCETVPAPWEPGTIWMDSADWVNVWKVTEDGERMRQLGTNAVRTCEYVQSTYGPMTQLVPKEQVDE